MYIRAQAEGACHDCDVRIKPGDKLLYIEGNNYVSHALCPKDEAKRKEAESQTIELSHAHSGNWSIPAPEGLEYRPFQRAGIQFALTRPKGVGTLFADEMGLGKTIQALGVINALQPKYVLIVCPASLKFNWRIEANEWLLGDKDVQVGSQPIFRPESPIHVHITNYDRLGELSSTISPDLFILDEVHYIKGRETERSKKTRYIARRSRQILGLSGTPLPNSPEDLWPILQILDPAVWTSWLEYSQRYCAAREAFRHIGKGPTKRLHKYTDTKGAANLEELQQKLRSSIMVRRLKKNVLTELPDKIHAILAFPPEGVEGLLAKQYELFSRFGFTEEMSVEEMKLHKVPFEEISATRKVLGVLKVDLVIDHIKQCFEEDEEKKIIVFAHHSEVLSKLYDKLYKFSPAIIRGETPDHKRQEEVQRFQMNPFCRLFVGSIQAAGAGITLTASSHVIFAEQSWSPKDMAQAWDRPHRIGQKNAVLVQHLVFDGSLDANIMKKLLKKIKIAQKALDTEV